MLIYYLLLLSNNIVIQGGNIWKDGNVTIQIVFPIALKSSNYLLTFAVTKNRVSAFYNEVLASKKTTYFELTQNDGSRVDYIAIGLC